MQQTKLLARPSLSRSETFIWLPFAGGISAFAVILPKPMGTGHGVGGGYPKRSILILLGMLCLGVAFAQGDEDAARPVKNVEEADGQIHWSDEMTPKNADAFVHNQIFIKAPASVIWSNLVKAMDWPKWYSNSSDVKITDGSELGPKTQFTWTTFNFPIASRIDEWVPNERISWYGDGPGIRAYHTWLIVSKADGCEVTTEETQVGPSAIKFNLAQPRAMYDAHDWWLSALKVRSENVAKD